MTLILDLPPEQLARLEQRAVRTGTSVANVVAALLDEQLDDQQDAPAETAPHDTNPDDFDYAQWSEAFKAWLASHRARNPNLDDSRENMYD